MNTFGAPMDEAAVPVADAALDQVQDIIDINDPALTSENIEMDTEKDAYAQPAPPPDGKWRAKLTLVKSKDAQKNDVDYLAARWGKGEPQTVIVMGVKATISDPNGEYDGIAVTDFNVSTFVQKRANTSKVATILGVLKKPDGSPWAAPGTKMSLREWADTLVKALAGEPEVGLETNWEWSCRGCGEEAKAKGEKYPRAIIGMNKFPVDQEKTRLAKGKTIYSPELKCQVNPAHGYSRARVQQQRIFSVRELK